MNVIRRRSIPVSLTIDYDKMKLDTETVDFSCWDTIWRQVERIELDENKTNVEDNVLHDQGSVTKRQSQVLGTPSCPSFAQDNQTRISAGSNKNGDSILTSSSLRHILSDPLNDYFHCCCGGACSGTCFPNKDSSLHLVTCQDNLGSRKRKNSDEATRLALTADSTMKQPKSVASLASILQETSFEIDSLFGNMNSSLIHPERITHPYNQVHPSAINVSAIDSLGNPFIYDVSPRPAISKTAHSNVKKPPLTEKYFTLILNRNRDQRKEIRYYQQIELSIQDVENALEQDCIKKLGKSMSESLNGRENCNEKAFWTPLTTNCGEVILTYCVPFKRHLKPSSSNTPPRTFQKESSKQNQSSFANKESDVLSSSSFSLLKTSYFHSVSTCEESSKVLDESIHPKGIPEFHSDASLKETRMKTTETTTVAIKSVTRKSMMHYTPASSNLATKSTKKPPRRTIWFKWNGLCSFSPIERASSVMDRFLRKSLPSMPLRTKSLTFLSFNPKIAMDTAIKDVSRNDGTELKLSGSTILHSKTEISHPKIIFVSRRPKEFLQKKNLTL